MNRLRMILVLILVGTASVSQAWRDLETGTFLTRDPIGFEDGPNQYCYVHCNPVTKFDPLGLNQNVITDGNRVFSTADYRTYSSLEANVGDYFPYVTAGTVAIVAGGYAVVEGGAAVVTGARIIAGSAANHGGVFIGMHEAMPAVLKTGAAITTAMGASAITAPKPEIPTLSPQNTSPALSGSASEGRSSNKLCPDPRATGDHTTFKTDNNGNVYKYETYEKTKTGYDNPVKRFDGGRPDGTQGRPHENSMGESVDTPHVQGKSIPDGVRPPVPSEIPKNPRFEQPAVEVKEAEVKIPDPEVNR